MSKSKFRLDWLKRKDENGHLLGWWCSAHKSENSKAICTLCDKEIQIASAGVAALLQHAKKKVHQDKAIVQLKSPQTETGGETNQQEDNRDQQASSSQSQPSQGRRQGSIEAFFIKSVEKAQPIENTTLCLQDEVAKAESLWALKSATDNFSFRSSDGAPRFFQRMFADSAVASSFTMSRTKVSYMIGHGLGPYFLQKTIDDVLQSFAFYTIHFDETTTAQMKKQMDVLIRYFSESEKEVKVRFLKALTFGHAKADTVTEELCKTIEGLGLPLQYLLSVCCDGPNVNKSIKKKLNVKLQEKFKRNLVETGPCQLHVVHNAFHKGVQAFGDDIENLCIDLFYFFKTSPARREDLAEIQYKIGLDEVAFIRHGESRWLCLLPAVERVKDQLPALRKYFSKLAENDPKIKANDRYRRIMRTVTSDDILVQLSFLQGMKHPFDQFLKFFQTEGPLIHMLFQQCSVF